MLYKIENLTRKFSNRTILDIPNLTLEDGSIYALLGPNGSGKTTLLNLLAFLDQPTSGRIYFRSQPAPNAKRSLVSLRRKVVLVDQHPIFFSTTVYKNLEFGLKIRKFTARKRKNIIEQALEMVGMEKFILAKAYNLSGGETKRVALARALALRPDVLLCDEPFANVDPESQAQIFQIIAQINSLHSISILFSSHDRPQAELLAHKTLYLQNGSLANGAMINCFGATVKTQGTNHVTCTLKNNIELTLPLPAIPFSSTRLKICIDPSQIVLSDKIQVASSTASRFSGMVNKIEAQGDLVTIVVQASELLFHIHLTMAHYSAAPPLAGEIVSIIIPHEAITIISRPG